LIGLAALFRTSRFRLSWGIVVTTPGESGAAEVLDATFGVAKGDIMAGKYRIERLLGQGGMGRVVAATHLQLQELVAIKFLLPLAAENPEIRARFVREAQATAKLRNEHVARVIDVGTFEGDLPYIVMEHLHGEDLSKLLTRRGRLPPNEAVDIVLQAIEAIAEAHALGIVHRDLKPSNLFLTETRDGALLVKVLDFGISKTLASSGEWALAPELTQTSTMMGSPLYMSPEQVRNAKSVDTRTDVWSLGVILYETLTGKPIFDATSPSALCAAIAADDVAPMRSHVPDLPPRLDAAVMRALQKPVDARFQDVAELASELAECVPVAALRSSASRSARLLSSSGAFRAAGARDSSAGPDHPSGSIAAATTIASPSTQTTDAKASPPRRVATYVGSASVVAVALGVAILLVARARTQPPTSSQDSSSAAPSSITPAATTASASPATIASNEGPSTPVATTASAAPSVSAAPTASAPPRTGSSKLAPAPAPTPTPAKRTTKVSPYADRE
jgi:serine/threonine-protein kinase